MLGAASRWRSRIEPPSEQAELERASKKKRRSRYRTWAELLARTFGVDALACPVCQGRMRLVAVLEDSARIARYLASIGEPTELPARSPSRGPPYWKSRVLRRMATATPLPERPRHRNKTRRRKRVRLSRPGDESRSQPVCRAVPFVVEARRDPLRTGAVSAALPKPPPAREVGGPDAACPMRLKLAEVAQSEHYAQRVGWLRCFRGIDTLTAVTILRSCMTSVASSHHEA